MNLEEKEKDLGISMDGFIIRLSNFANIFIYRELIYGAKNFKLRLSKVEVQNFSSAHFMNMK